jgi:hypothetical protein
MLKENTKSNAQSQREICSTIYDSGDVIKSRIATTMMGYISLKESVSLTDLKELQAMVDRDVSEQISGLVDRVIKVLT